MRSLCPTHSAPHTLLRSLFTHDHPDGAILGFVKPEHEVVDTDSDAGTSMDHAHASPDRGLGFGLTSLSASVSSGEEWITGMSSTMFVVRVLVVKS